MKQLGPFRPVCGVMFQALNAKREPSGVPQPCAHPARLCFDFEGFPIPPEHQQHVEHGEGQQTICACHWPPLCFGLATLLSAAGLTPEAIEDELVKRVTTYDG